MLLVHPIDELRKYVVPLAATALFGATQGGGPLVAVIAVLAPLVLGVVRYLTTTYRVADGRVELRRGLLNRQRLSTAIDRVRTVDIAAPLVHRAVGLTTLSIGTGGVGGDSDDLKLDGLTVAQGQDLRRLLLASRTAPDEPAGDDAAPPVARYESGWLRFAPFTSAGLAILGGLLGAGVQLLNEVEVEVDVVAEDLAGDAAVAVAAAVVGIAVLVLALTVLGYLVTNWQFTLRRQADTWHVSRGLLTTRETSIDVDRLAGVSVAEPPGLRLARGARLTAIVTGLGGAQRGSQVLVPPAPSDVVRRAGAAVLGSAQPLVGPLTGHGPAAVRRRWIRAVGPAAAVAAVPTAAVVAGAPVWVLVLPLVVLLVAMALAADRARSLGHGLLAGHVVTRSGSLLRSRDALADAHVIGWSFRDTWFQRRAGLTTLAATTAGGRGKVEALDIPTARAVTVAAEVTPDLVAQFTTSSASGGTPYGSRVTDYAPQPDGRPDPGEVCWAWVPYEDDPARGKDRPVLVIAARSDGGEALVDCLVMTSKDHDRDEAQEAAAGRHWMDVGAGGWDRELRPSEVRLDRVVVLRESDVRREGAALDPAIYAAVLAARAALTG